MLLVMECVIACALFALVILWTQYKAPIKYIMSYPPEIRKRQDHKGQHHEYVFQDRKEGKSTDERRRGMSSFGIRKRRILQCTENYSQV